MSRLPCFRLNSPPRSIVTTPVARTPRVARATITTRKKTALFMTRHIEQALRQVMHGRDRKARQLGKAACRHDVAGHAIALRPADCACSRGEAALWWAATTRQGGGSVMKDRSAVDAVLGEAVDAGAVAGVVSMASDASGNIYEGA